MDQYRGQSPPDDEWDYSYWYVEVPSPERPLLARPWVCLRLEGMPVPEPVPLAELFGRLKAEGWQLHGVAGEGGRTTYTFKRRTPVQT